MGVKQKSAKGSKIIRRNALQLLAFGFATGRQGCGEVSFEDSAREFVKHFGLSGEINPESLARQLRRMGFDYFQEGV